MSVRSIPLAVALIVLSSSVWAQTGTAPRSRADIKAETARQSAPDA
jgi:hypothetical protein